MRLGCCSTGRSADGLLEWHRIRSIVYKMREPAGEEAEWIAVAHVMRVVAVAHRISEGPRAARGTETIWQSLAMVNSALGELRLGIGRLIKDFRAGIDGMAYDGQTIPECQTRLPSSSL